MGSKELVLASLNTIAQAPLAEVRSNYDQYINPALMARMLGIDYCPTFERGEGVYLWDCDGKRHLDCHSGYGALALGHNHPNVVAAMRWALDNNVVNLAQASISRWQGALGKALSDLTDGKLQHSFFSNSGAEAVEGALKTARKATGRTRIVCTENSFHGKTFGALSVTGQLKYQKPFGPLVGDVVCIPFGNLAALRELLVKRDVAAFILEPIQGEGGVIVPDAGYIQKVAEACKQFGTLLIVDEIQTGFGRTGSGEATNVWFRFRDLEVEPDIACFAKALAGGISAIGVTMTTDKVWHAAYGEKQDSALHTSTFGGGAISCIVGLATIETLKAERLNVKAAETGEWLRKELLSIQSAHPALIQEVRGRGLMLGIDFRKQQRNLATAAFAAVTKLVEKATEEEAIAALVARELLKRGVVTAFTLNRENVIRVAPPLIATKEQLQELVDALHDVLGNFKSLWELNGGLLGAIQALKKP